MQDIRRAGNTPQFQYSTTSELQEQMKEGLKRLKEQSKKQASSSKERREWVHPNTAIPFHRLVKLNSRVGQLETIIGDKPNDWKKPNYGHLDYTIAHRMGWISDQEEAIDRKYYENRRALSLKTCHRYKGQIEGLPDNPADTSGGRYTPEISSSILNDNHLTDGSKLLMLKIMEETYRKNREGRWLEITVTFLMKAMSRSRRTIQNYMRLLERLGYIEVSVITSAKARMCIGLCVQLSQKVFPDHHKEKWPEKRENSGVQIPTLNYSKQLFNILIPLEDWAMKCMNGIFRSYERNRIEQYPNG